MGDLNPQVAAALVAATVSLLVAVWTYWSTRSNQRDVERLKDELAQRKAERDAFRDYEYEARKRLYQHCGPLIFQLSEQADAVLHRIRNLARAASRGNLDAPGSWLGRDYYRLSTFYRFIAPLATIKLLQARLTLVDLSLDAYLHFQYAIAKQVVSSFGDDFDLAKLNSPTLPYDPHSPEAGRLRSQEPAAYWQQGVPAGILDNAAESLLADKRERIMSFVEFEREFRQGDSQLRGAFDRIEYLFENFHPHSRPVLWRLLLAQVLLYRALLGLPRGNHTAEELGHLLLSLAKFPESERGQLNWRSGNRLVGQESSFEQELSSAEQYAQSAFGSIAETMQSRTYVAST